MSRLVRKTLSFSKSLENHIGAIWYFIDHYNASLLVWHYRFQLDSLYVVSSRVVSAFRDERALKVYRFLQQDLTPTRMYHIYELIRDDFGGNMNNLASDKDWTRFTRSVNHQEVFGDDSRHIASKEKPPANPMSLDEAQAFISRVADSWFRRKCIDDNNAH